MAIETVFRMEDVEPSEVSVSRKRDGSSYRLAVYRKGTRPDGSLFVACEVDIIFAPEQVDRLIAHLTELRAMPKQSSSALEQIFDDIRKAFYE